MSNTKRVAGFAILSAVLVASTSIAGVVSPASASIPNCSPATLASNPNVTSGSTANVLASTEICEIVVGSPVVNVGVKEWNFIVPEGVTKVYALLVGGGGGGYFGEIGRDAANTVFYGYAAGGAGQAQLVEFDKGADVGSFELKLKVGDGGSGGQDLGIGAQGAPASVTRFAGSSNQLIESASGGGGGSFVTVIGTPTTFTLSSGSSKDFVGADILGAAVAVSNPSSSLYLYGAGAGGPGGAKDLEKSPFSADSFLPAGTNLTAVQKNAIWTLAVPTVSRGGTLAYKTELGIPDGLGRGGTSGIGASLDRIARNGNSGQIRLRYYLPGSSGAGSDSSGSGAGNDSSDSSSVGGSGDSGSEAPTVAPAPYSGPVTSLVGPGTIGSEATTVRVSGQRLDGITKVEILGRELEILTKSATEIVLRIPKLEPGVYSLIYTSSSGVLTHQNALTVKQGAPTKNEGDSSASPGEQAPVVKTVLTKQRFSVFGGGSSRLPVQDANAIRAFLDKNPGITHITCVGSTSGVPAAQADRRLALERARTACAFVERALPGISTKVLASTGKGVGEFYRSAVLFAKVGR
ncbi:hypothetical protein [Candidatus Aquiluna sp. UB-MaderosW2red]|uniref:hypothetical protein n=1 Tax=Candidatus Aquiluna sp. UB-MaderosW2red TaxID=1855377 RepID=UPI000875E5F9|nr:hypothetical protein [Candidatus Aquiluna sp. UB-MaderosW2red]SCX05870.1 hypothetical protein SAMN05216534_0458 [Candidatus Aquiluna sp. UB-MaderosW2red]